MNVHLCKASKNFTGIGFIKHQYFNIISEKDIHSLYSKLQVNFNGKFAMKFCQVDIP